MTAIPVPLATRRIPVRPWHRSHAEDPSHVALRSDVVAHIAENARDPELNADRIAAHLGISLRTLLRVFEKSSMTVACHIAAARLARALDTLRSRDHAHLRDHEVARRAGYGCPSVMGRAVLLATGMTPREHRDEVLGMAL